MEGDCKSKQIEEGKRMQLSKFLTKVSVNLWHCKNVTSGKRQRQAKR